MIRTRFAPSPTGAMHIGSLRTALYAYALAKHDTDSRSRFILRIEDTDKKREVKGGKEKIYQILKMFELDWDEGPEKGGQYGPYIQSERKKIGIYKEAAKMLVDRGRAYEDGGAIRLKVPKNETISYHDFVLDKDISWDTNTLQDLVLLKSDGFPTYHLAVVVDDMYMHITHVLRGHDWLPSTPIHLLLYKFLNWDAEQPLIGHLTDILDPEGGKLSKRKGSTSVEGFLKEGYLPEAILNFVMLLGWAPKDNREFFHLDEFVRTFDIKGLQKSNPVFNKQKLDWFNKHYYQEAQLKNKFVSFVSGASGYSQEVNFPQVAAGTASIVAPRVSNITDYDNLIKPFFKNPTIRGSALGMKGREHLNSALDVLENVKTWNKKEIDKVLLELVNQKKFDRGDFFMDLRIAITGSNVSLPINDIIEKLDKQTVIDRIKKLLK